MESGVDCFYTGKHETEVGANEDLRLWKAGGMFACHAITLGDEADELQFDAKVSYKPILSHTKLSRSKSEKIMGK